MTSRRKVVWVNLIILGIVLACAIALYGTMQGSIGARVYAKSLRGGSPADRMRACIALQNFGSRGAAAVPALLEVLQNPDDKSAPACARALREIDPQAAYEYAGDLAAKKPALSATVIGVFGNLGPVAWRAIPLVRTALGRAEHIRELLPALIDMGDYSDQVVAEIVADSRDPVYSVKKWDAMLAFNSLSDLGERIRPELERLSFDSTPAVAGQAKMILGKIQNQPKYSMSGLTGFPAHDQSYQEYTLDRLSKQGPRAADAIPDIVAEFHSNSVLMRFTAAWTLMHIGSAARSALPELRAALGDQNTVVRDGAADAIHAIEGTP